jgi:hypothetical protein
VLEWLKGSYHGNLMELGVELSWSAGMVVRCVRKEQRVRELKFGRKLKLERASALSTYWSAQLARAWSGSRGAWIRVWAKQRQRVGNENERQRCANYKQ